MGLWEVTGKLPGCFAFLFSLIWTIRGVSSELKPHNPNMLPPGHTLASARQLLLDQGSSVLRRANNEEIDIKSAVDEIGEVLRKHASYFDAGAAEGNSGEIPEQTRIHGELAKQKQASVVCETGFNMGHSAINWILHSAPGARYIGFDAGKMFHVYPEQNAGLINDMFRSAHSASTTTEAPGRIRTTSDRVKVYWGDSSKTLPDFVNKHHKRVCDLVHVDGGHYKDIPESDLKYMQRIAKPNALLIIDDVNCVGWAATSSRSGCKKPDTVWKRFIELGLIREQACYRFTPGRGFCFGYYVHGGRKSGYSKTSRVATPPSVNLTRTRK